MVRHPGKGCPVLEGGPGASPGHTVQAAVEAALPRDVPFVAGGTPQALLELGPQAVAAHG